jgi:hypothetical protein
MRNPFKTNTVLAGSLNASAELLCANEQTVITVMESWDHAVKMPNGYTSELVFTWNTALRDDWRRVQNDANVRVFYPLKLRYARDTVSTWAARRALPVRPFFVYSVASTRRFSIQVLVDLEQKLIRDLARAADAVGWDLFVKPRPNGEPAEFMEVLKEFPNVRIGSVLDRQAQQAADYFLSDEYNHSRFSEINGARFVVNAFTTFGLDCAAAGIPVLQIDLRRAEGYADSNFIYQNYHLKSYLLPSEFVFRVRGDLVSSLIDFLKSPDDRPEKYSEELLGWLFGGQTQRAAVEDLVNRSITLAKTTE